MKNYYEFKSTKEVANLKDQLESKIDKAKAEYYKILKDESVNTILSELLEAEKDNRDEDAKNRLKKMIVKDLVSQIINNVQSAEKDLRKLNVF